MSGRGTMTSSTGVSEKSKTLSIICCSSGSSTPARSPWRSSMRSSTSLCEASSSLIVSMPSMRMTRSASQSRNEMNHPKMKKNTAIRGATASATCSARGSVYDFGTISPITTCRIEMKNSASATDTTADAQNDTCPKRLSSTRRDRGLAECAERDRRERDAELEGRDEARGIRDDPAHRARPAVALRHELVEACVAHRDERVLRRDEERVPEDAEADQDEPDHRPRGHRRALRAGRCRLGGSSSLGATSVICLPECGAASTRRSRRLLERDRPRGVK